MHAERDSERESTGTHEARDDLEGLLDRIEHGESIVITKRGAPVARLVPYEGVPDPARVDRAIARLREVRKDMRLGGLSIRELIDEGRR